MSISLPEFTVTSKQFFTNGTQRIEMTVHDNKLYIMGHEGGSIVGGTIILDPLPSSAIYGTQGGASSSDGVNFTLTLGEQDFASWTQADTDALIAAIKAETGAAQVNITIESGSVKAVVDVVLPSGSDQAAKDAVLAKVDTVPKLNAILAASPSATLQTAAGQNNTATAPVVKNVQITSELVGSSVVGGNVIFDILGAYQAIQWKSGGNWITLASPFPTSAFGEVDGAQTIEFRLLSPDSSVLGIPASISVAFPTLGPTPMYHWALDGDLTDSGPYGTTFTPISGDLPHATFNTLNGRQGLTAFNFVDGDWVKMPFDPSGFTTGLTFMLWIVPGTGPDYNTLPLGLRYNCGFLFRVVDENRFYSTMDYPGDVEEIYRGLPTQGGYLDEGYHALRSYEGFDTGVYRDLPTTESGSATLWYRHSSAYPFYKRPLIPKSGTTARYTDNTYVHNEYTHIAMSYKIENGKMIYKQTVNGETIQVIEYDCGEETEFFPAGKKPTELWIKLDKGSMLYTNPENVSRSTRIRGPQDSNGNPYFPGYQGNMYSDIRLYAGALTEAEVNAIYTA